MSTNETPRTAASPWVTFKGYEFLAAAAKADMPPQARILEQFGYTRCIRVEGDELQFLFAGAHSQPHAEEARATHDKHLKQVFPQADWQLRAIRSPGGEPMYLYGAPALEIHRISKAHSRAVDTLGDIEQKLAMLPRIAVDQAYGVRLDASRKKRLATINDVTGWHTTAQSHQKQAGYNKGLCAAADLPAGHQGVLERMRQLVDAGADPNAAAPRLPLLVAAEKNAPDVILLLLEAGASLHARSDSGSNALHAACGKGSLEAARLLLKLGIDPTARNALDQTPRDRALAFGHTSLAHELDRANRKATTRVLPLHGNDKLPARAATAAAAPAALPWPGLDGRSAAPAA